MIRKYASVSEMGREQHRKRKKSSLASRFELVRPVKCNIDNPQAPPSLKTNQVDPIKKIERIPSTSEMSSKSMPSLGSTKIDMFEKKKSPEKATNVTHINQDDTTSTNVPHIPAHLQGSEKHSPEALSHINPLNFVLSCFKAYNVDSTLEYSLSKENYFPQVTESNFTAYQSDAIQAIRNKDIVKLRQIKKSGRSLQGCNRFGESLLHIACRRGSADMLAFLINDGECSLRVIDDYGRTPLHDACWQSEPNFDLIEIILDAEPDLLLLKDKRGHVALEYVRREHWGVWVKYLSYRMKTEIRRRRKNVSTV